VLGALERGAAQFLHAPGELVAGLLELREGEQRRARRPAQGRRRMLARRHGRDVREAGGDDRRQLALQALDLPAQRVAGVQLGERGAGAPGVERWLRPADHLLLALHQPVSSQRVAQRREAISFAVAKLP
jgi:hypothetical protein